MKEGYRERTDYNLEGRTKNKECQGGQRIFIGENKEYGEEQITSWREEQRTKNARENRKIFVEKTENTGVNSEHTACSRKQRMPGRTDRISDG